MEKEKQRFVMKFLWLKGCGAKRIHEKLMSTLGDNSYAVSQIKTWLQKFRNGDLSCKRLSALRATSLNFGTAT
jgi:hypothetical protein